MSGAVEAGDAVGLPGDRKVSDRPAHFIAGKWLQPAQGQSATILNPATEERLATVPVGTTADASQAIIAARSALAKWSALPPSDRARYLERLRLALSRRQEEVAQTIALEVGSPIRIARRIQAALPVTVLASYVELLRTFEFEEQVGSSRVFKQPVGVVVAVTPWNYPLHQAVAKVAPALAAGCTVVLKPSLQAPLSAFLLADSALEADLPAGVLNLVSGSGATLGEVLATHPEVDMVSFTGSSAAGAEVAQHAARSFKKLTLELGGKSANLILPDADLQRAVKVGVANAFLNNGQTCNAWTRMLVQRKQVPDVLEIARASAESMVVGDPLDEGTRLGPVISAQQRDRVRGYIRDGISGGAHLLTGGQEVPDGLDRGFYLRPTIFSEVASNMKIAREEVFGPVLCILSYEDEDEAVEIANDSQYGLGGAVWSSDQEKAIALARRLRTGQVDINGAAFNPEAPFGGFKQSGSGRELGRYGLEEFLQTTSLQL